MDIGSGSVKAGWAGNALPHAEVPSVSAVRVRSDDGTESETGGGGYGIHVGESAWRRRNSETHMLSRPLQRGRVRDWDAFERLLLHTVIRYLQ